MASNCERYWILTESTNTYIFLYDHSDASVKFVDFPNLNLARMVNIRPWNFDYMIVKHEVVTLPFIAQLLEFSVAMFLFDFVFSNITVSSISYIVFMSYLIYLSP